MSHGGNFVFGFAVNPKLRLIEKMQMFAKQSMLVLLHSCCVGRPNAMKKWPGSIIYKVCRRTCFPLLKTPYVTGKQATSILCN